MVLALELLRGMMALMDGSGVMPPPRGDEKRNELRARCVECAEDRRDVRPGYVWPGAGPAPGPEGWLGIWVAEEGCAEGGWEGPGVESSVNTDAGVRGDPPDRSRGRSRSLPRYGGGIDEDALGEMPIPICPVYVVRGLTEAGCT